MPITPGRPSNSRPGMVIPPQQGNQRPAGASIRPVEPSTRQPARGLNAQRPNEGRGDGATASPERNRPQSRDAAYNSARHTEEYDFGSEALPVRNSRQVRTSQPQDREPMINEFDPADDDTFAPVSVDDQLIDADDDDARRRAMKRAARAERSRSECVRRSGVPSSAPSYDVLGPLGDDDDDMIELNRDDLDDDVEEKRDVAPRPTPAPVHDDEDDDSYDDEDETEEEPESEPTPAAAQSKLKSKKRGKKNKGEPILDEDGREMFIDPETKKILPFGERKGHERKVKEHEFDSRNNRQRQVKILQIIVFFLLGAIAVAGLKNAFFPATVPNADEIGAIAKEQTGQTNFPLTRGEGFARDCLQSYLTAGTDDSSAQVLNYCYTGSTTTQNGVANRNLSSNYRQSIVFGPTIYEAKALTDYSARYTVGAVVKASSTEVKQAPQTKMMFFNVNIYYNQLADSFTLVSDSPSITAPPQVGIDSNVPESAPLGTGEADSELANQVKSTVIGFMKGYAVSSPTNHSSLDQYVVVNPPATLLQGLNNQYEFSGSANDAISYEAYPTADPNQVKVKAEVTWRVPLGSAAEASTRAEFKSTYVITLDKQDNGQFLVSRFQPQYYAMAEGATDQPLDSSNSEATDPTASASATSK